jgi:uncharacterized protein YndB with AHSA1/START domain
MDASPHIEVCVTQRFSASAERVFDAWLDPKRAGKWLFATAACPMSRVKIDARVGGSFSFVDRQGSEGVVHAGEYLDIVRPRRLVFALSMENSPKVVTRVIAEIAPLKRDALRPRHDPKVSVNSALSETESGPLAARHSRLRSWLSRPAYTAAKPMNTSPAAPTAAPTSRCNGTRGRWVASQFATRHAASAMAHWINANPARYATSGVRSAPTMASASA